MFLCRTQPPPQISDKQLEEREHSIDQWKGDTLLSEHNALNVFNICAEIYNSFVLKIHFIRADIRRGDGLGRTEQKRGDEGRIFWLVMSLHWRPGAQQANGSIVLLIWLLTVALCRCDSELQCHHLPVVFRQ